MDLDNEELIATKEDKGLFQNAIEDFEIATNNLISNCKDSQELEIMFIRLNTCLRDLVRIRNNELERSE